MTVLTPIRKLAALDAVDEMLAFARVRLRKAERAAIEGGRQALLDDVLARFTDDIAGYFRAMATRVTSTIRKVEAFDFDPDADVDWTVEDAELTAVLVRWYAELGATAYAAVTEQLGVELRFDLQGRSADGIRDAIATRVTSIDETSREALRTLVEGFTEGTGVSVDDFERAIHDLVQGWASTPPGGASSRAHAIALTETTTATNLATTAGYRESGLVDEVVVFDGPDCGWTDHDDPDLADGSIRTLDEADQYPEAHPHCQRAFGPVVAGADTGTDE